MRTSRTALQEDHEHTVAILYRTNAQSRTLEDALRRSGIPYRIIGGVRFYERKEIKDALAYLRLLVNPHDTVSLRRVINVPARGIGRGVLDALDRVDVSPGDETSPLLAGLDAGAAPDSLWTRLTHAVDRRLLPPRGLTALSAFRELIAGLTALVDREPVSTLLGSVLDRSGYIQDLRDERSEEARGRLENLAELVSAAREYETQQPEPSLAGFVDTLSLLSDADEESGAREKRASC